MKMSPAFKGMTLFVALFLSFLTINADQETIRLTSDETIINLDDLLVPVRIHIEVSDADILIQGNETSQIELGIDDLEDLVEDGDGSAEVRINHDTGDVRIRLGGDAKESDIICVIPVSSSVQLTSSDGDIAVEGLSGDLDCRTSDGDISIVDVHGSISVDSTDGDIFLRQSQVSMEPISIAAVDGDISLNLAPSANARISVNLFDGDLSFDTSGKLEVLGNSGKKSKRSDGRKSPIIKIGTSEPRQLIQISGLDSNVTISNQ